MELKTSQSLGRAGRDNGGGATKLREAAKVWENGDGSKEGRKNAGRKEGNMKNQKNNNSKTTGNNEQTYILLLSARLVLMQRFD